MKSKNVTVSTLSFAKREVSQASKRLAPRKKAVYQRKAKPQTTNTKDSNSVNSGKKKGGRVKTATKQTNANLAGEVALSVPCDRDSGVSERQSQSQQEQCEEDGLEILNRKRCEGTEVSYTTDEVQSDALSDKTGKESGHSPSLLDLTGAKCVDGIAQCSSSIPVVVNVVWQQEKGKETLDPSLDDTQTRLKTFASSSWKKNAVLPADLLAGQGFFYAGGGTIKCFFCHLSVSELSKNDDVESLHARESPSCPQLAKKDPASALAASSRPVPQGSSAKGEEAHRSKKGKKRKKKNQADIGNGTVCQVEAPMMMPETPEFTAEPYSVVHLESGQPHAEESQSGAYVVVTNKTYRRPQEQAAPEANASGSVNRDVRGENVLAGSADASQTSTPSSVATSSSSAVVSNNVSVSRSTQQPAYNTPSNPQAPGGQPAPNAGQSQQAANTPEVQAGDTGSGGTQRSAANNSYEQLNIITSRPKRQEYAVTVVRLQSFQGWPADHHLKPEDLAEAGYFYTGFSDTARCFYCGGGLRNWEKNDDVWVEHSRWFPKCAFVQIKKGKNFVEAVQELSKSQETISFQDVMTHLTASSRAPPTLDDLMKRDPSVLAVVEEGYEIQDVILVAKEQKKSAGTLSAERVLEELLSRNKKPKSVKSDLIIKKMKNIEALKMDNDKVRELNTQARQQMQCKICFDKEVGVVFLPCGHFVSCTDCACALKDCPVCRDQVRGMVPACTAGL